jgi:putative transposase
VVRRKTQEGYAVKQDNIVAPSWTREERQDFLEDELRQRTRGWIEVMVNEELDQALGLGRSQRGAERLGYRKGKRVRQFTTVGGRHELVMPRGAYFAAGPDGKREWNSRIIPRYARRSAAVEDALIKSYLGGTNTRKIRGALEPLLCGAALSKSTISRILAVLEEQFGRWRQRDLAHEDIAILFLDGFYLKRRLAGRVERMPVLSALGVRADGTRLLLALEIRAAESELAWRAVTEQLARRGVRAPILAVIDGNDGLGKAVRDSWPWLDLQRCTKHKGENLATHAPKRRQAEIKRDYDAIIQADDERAARAAWRRFEDKWRKDCPGVVKSLNEAGEELLTFYRYPPSLWKMLRTSNAIERVNEEFRRRVKTQGALPNVASGLKLLYGLVASGAIHLKRIDGWRELPAVVVAKRAALLPRQSLDKAG